MSVAVYAYDGVGTFSAGENVDIRAAFLGGGSGLALLDSASFQLTSTGVDGLISTYTPTLDISGAGAQQLFLNFNNYRPGATESWSVVDNIEIIPEPATIGLVGVFGAGVLFIRRRFMI